MEQRKEDLEINIDDEEIERISGFCWSAEMVFHRLTGPKYLNIDYKYDVCANPIQRVLLHPLIIDEEITRISSFSRSPEMAKM